MFEKSITECRCEARRLEFQSRVVTAPLSTRTTTAGSRVRAGSFNQEVSRDKFARQRSVDVTLLVV